MIFEIFFVIETMYMHLIFQSLCHIILFVNRNFNWMNTYQTYIKIVVVIVFRYLYWCKYLNPQAIYKLKSLRNAFNIQRQLNTCRYYHTKYLHHLLLRPRDRFQLSRNTYPHKRWTHHLCGSKNRDDLQYKSLVCTGRFFKNKRY